MNADFYTPSKKIKIDHLHSECDIKSQPLDHSYEDIKPNFQSPKKPVLKCNNCQTLFEDGVATSRTNAETNAVDIYLLCQECYKPHSEPEESEPESYHKDLPAETPLPSPPKLCPVPLIDFLCNLCYEQIPFKDFQAHANDHTDEGQYICWICSYHKRIKQFSSNFALIRHLALHYENPFQCNNCLQRFPFKELLDQHFKKSHPDLTVYACNSCPGIHLDLNIYLDHLKTIHGKNFDCKECEARFTNMTELQHHLRMKHTEDQELELKCTTCRKAFKTVEDLKLHMQIVHKEFQCKVCVSKFSTQMELDDHSKTHSPLKVLNSEDGEDGFTCPQCSNKYTYKYNLKRHFKNAHSRIRLPDSLRVTPLNITKTSRSCEIPTPSTPNVEDGFTCPLCPKKYTVKYQLKRHFKHVHRKMRLPDSLRVESLNTYETSPRRQFPKLSTPNVEGGFTCPHCPKKYTVKYQFKRHFRHVHQKMRLPDSLRVKSLNTSETSPRRQIPKPSTPNVEGGFTCPHCPKKYTLKVHFKQHFKRVHPKMRFPDSLRVKPLNISKASPTRETPRPSTPNVEGGFTGPHCPKKYTLKAQHFKTVHRKMRFRDSLRVNQKNVFTCPQCSNKYALQTSLKRHFLTAHSRIPLPASLRVKPRKTPEVSRRSTPKTSEVCFNCTQCSKTFSRKYNLDKHLENVHSRLPVLVSPRGNPSNTPEVATPITSIYTCRVCDLSFPTKSVFSRHFNSHSVVAPFISVFGTDCTVCHLSFDTNKLLCRHLLKHKILTFSCHVCGIDSKTPLALRSHLLKHNESVVSIRSNSPEPRFRSKSVTGSPIKMSDPKKIFKRRQSLSSKPDKPVTGSPEIMSDPKKIFKRRQSMSSKPDSCSITPDWTPLDTRPFICLTCDQTLTTTDQILFHSKLHKIRPFCCPICPKKYVVLNAIAVHILFAHPETTLTYQLSPQYFKPQNVDVRSETWNCPVCLKNFPELDKDHFQACRGAGVQKCNICDVSFQGKYGSYALMKHATYSKTHLFKSNELTQANGGQRGVKRRWTEIREESAPRLCRRVSVGYFMENEPDSEPDN